MKSDFALSPCSCGKAHTANIDDIIIGRGVIRRLPELLSRYGAVKPFVLADVNTYRAAGESVVKLLQDHNIEFSSHVFQSGRLEPDENAVGAAVMHFDHTCDMIIGIGSGVIHDIGKILSSISNKKYIIVATATSMDGYASATSSMSMDGVKVSLLSRPADIIIGDTNILAQAPADMLISGLGDMLAKYISIAEWRISHVINGEYYCEEIAALVRGALKKCIDNVEGLLKRDEAAIRAIFEGLIISGVAMAYAGVSRPASGVEHYISHIWDMRGLSFGTAVSTHGIQCAIGTLYAAKIYDKLKKISPDKVKALSFVARFDYASYSAQLKTFLGKGADAMIALETKEKKYDVEKHTKRLDTIISEWDKIVKIIEEEIPAPDEIERLLRAVRCPKTAEEIGIDPNTLLAAFYATRDIRDKYVLSRLCWDLGVEDGFFNQIFI